MTGTPKETSGAWVCALRDSSSHWRSPLAKPAALYSATISRTDQRHCTCGSGERTEATMSDSDTCRVKVVCRVRPLNAKEHANGSSFVVNFPSETTVALKVRQNSVKPISTHRIHILRACKLLCTRLRSLLVATAVYVWPTWFNWPWILPLWWLLPCSGIPWVVVKRTICFMVVHINWQKLICSLIYKSSYLTLSGWRILLRCNKSSWMALNYPPPPPPPP